MLWPWIAVVVHDTCCTVTPVYLLQRVHFVMSPDNCFAPVFSVAPLHCFLPGFFFWRQVISFVAPLLSCGPILSVVDPGYLKAPFVVVALF